MKIKLSPFILMIIMTLSMMTGSLKAEDMRPILKDKIITSKDVLTIGDFFYHAGRHAQTPIFRAPDPGVMADIDVSAILSQARRHGLTKVQTKDIRSVNVIRTAHLITAQAIEEKIHNALISKYRIGEIGELQLSFDAPLNDIQGHNATGEIKLRSLEYRPQNGRFNAILRYQENGVNGKLKNIALKGSASEIIDVPVAIRNIPRGDIIAIDDIRIEKMTFNSSDDSQPLTFEDVVGKESRRLLKAGASLYARDLKEPTLVSRNDLVSIIYQQNSLRLTAQGRALESGAKGDIVSVINAQSKQTVRAIVEDQGLVNVQTASF